MRNLLPYVTGAAVGIALGLATLAGFSAFAKTDWTKQHDDLKAKCVKLRSGDDGAVLYLRDGHPLCVNWRAADPKPLWGKAPAASK
jgi:hypothetical protein